MIRFPKKRLFGLVGVPRAGKDAVSKFLKETRDFAVLAFADRIKEEYGISKEDFEVLKVTGDIDRIRQELWDFSQSKKEKDPLYFVRKVIQEAINKDKSAVITDIRTPEEVDAFLHFDYGYEAKDIRKIYYISSSPQPLIDDFDENGTLIDSKLPIELIASMLENGQVRLIENNKEDGLFYFNRHLDNLFFEEDIMDLPDCYMGNSSKWRSMVSSYLSQFDVIQRRT